MDYFAAWVIGWICIYPGVNFNTITWSWTVTSRPMRSLMFNGWLT